MEKSITVLAIESSCDDTGVAVVRKEGDGVTVLSNLLNSQSIHNATGGVVPESAGREHAKVISLLIHQAMQDAGLEKDDISAIALTVAPGLMPSLAVGVQAGKALAYAWDKPIVPVHHLEGHVYSALLQKDQSSTTYNLQPTAWPALAVIISGGHTMLIQVDKHLTYKILGETRDDAIGEVFDKVARMLHLGYPGGPLISKLALQGNPRAFHFPRPMQHSHTLDFSYAGLKTAVMYQVRDLGDGITDKDRADIAASFQQAICDSVAGKLELALTQGNYSSMLFAGGVAANTALRNRMKEVATQYDIDLFVAPLELCGDNAVMIGEVGVYAFQEGRVKNWREIDATAKVSIEEFSK